MSKMDSWGSYPKIYAVGHRAVRGYLDSEVIVEEKVDGSQLSFGVDFDGEIRIRSKNREFSIDEPDNLFAEAAEQVKALSPALTPGYTYRGEYLKRPRHNGLAYERVPHRHIIIFDVATGDQEYLDHHERAKEALRIGLESVPVIDTGTFTASDLEKFFEFHSVLGGQRIEGVVVKAQHTVWGEDKKPLIAKMVRPDFKEMQQKQFRRDNPTKGDIIDQLVEELSSEQRFEKAMQHLRDDGRLEGTPRDIGELVKEVQRDVREECADYIAERLYRHAWKQIERRIVRPVPDWYKSRLAHEDAA